MGHAEAERFEAQAKHAQRCRVFARCRTLPRRPGTGDDAPHLARFFGEFVLGQQTPELLEHRADERCFAVACHAAEFARQHAGHQRAQELFFQLVGVRLVVHVLEQHQARCWVADAGNADQRDRARPC